MPEVAQIEKLITPLRDNSDRVFDERDNDEKAANGGQVPAVQHRISNDASIDGVGTIMSLSNGMKGHAHGLRGSPNVLRKSSILLVCSLIWSSGLGSFVASLPLGLPN